MPLKKQQSKLSKKDLPPNPLPNNQPNQPMKHLLSIHVYDSTTPSEFDALIELLAGMKSRHAATDPAPGHPELPLPASLTGLVNQPAKKFHFLDETDTRLPIPRHVTTECHKCGGGTGQEDPCVCGVRHAATIAAADPLKVAMDDPVEATSDDTIRANHMQKRFWIYGPSGCGKTYTARAIMQGSEGCGAIIDIDDESQKSEKGTIEELLKDKSINTLIVTCNDETRFRSFAKLFHRVRISRPVLNII
jgi:hypothetical protein